MGETQVDDVFIDRATPGDVDGILQLAEANSPARGGELTGFLDRAAVTMTIGTLPSIVARRGSEIVGFLLTWEKTTSENPYVRAMLDAYPGSAGAYVYGPVCVDVSVRRQGLTRLMFQRLRSLLPDREGILFIRANNESSLRAHRQLDMRETAQFTYGDRIFFVFSYT